MSQSPSIITELAWRGLIADIANRPILESLLAKPEPLTVYIGFDPTADSLHVGHLMGLLLLRRFQKAGHRPIVVAGGATGMIGDPSGKSAERNLQTEEGIEANLRGIEPQLRHLLDFEPGPTSAILVNNASWTKPLSFLEFLRDVGKHMTVNSMMARDSVKSRIDGTSGISFTEFSYALIQANDFLQLFTTYGCALQAGGSDQWGNITAGIDLIWRKKEAQVCGLTTPLLLKSDGTKFGKTEEGAVWLSAEKTSVYRFYQFFLQAEDAAVGKLLRYLTFLNEEEILAIETTHAESPEKRSAQRVIARELTTMIHGKTATEDAIRASEVLFGGSVQGLQGVHFEELAKEVPTFNLPAAQIGQATLIDLLKTTELSPSGSQARKDIEAGGVYVNNERVQDSKLTLTESHLLCEKFILLRKGKKNYALVKFE